MTTETMLVAGEEPVPPAAVRPGPRRWLRENLFSSPANGILTVIVLLVLGRLLWGIAGFVFGSAQWEVVRRNLTNLMVGLFPREDLWRVWAALYLAAVGGGLAGGAARAEADAEAVRRGLPEDATARAGWAYWLEVLGPPAALLTVLLGFTRTVVPGLLTAGAIVVAVVASRVGPRLPLPVRRRPGFLAAATVLGCFLVILAAGGVGWNDWGGLLLTIFLALGGIVLCFPLGILLALGRRSSLPAVRAVSTAFIELVRGVPLVTLLLMAAFMLGFFFPPGFPTPSLVTRALIVFVLFSSAYVAEIVRGGLQSVPRGQVEAAEALGLSRTVTLRKVVLPQALRAVIPATVGQFISLYKDTSLVGAIGLAELLVTAQNITKQPDFSGQGLQTETLLFASFVYWVGAYSLSKASQRLERRLGVGIR